MPSRRVVALIITFWLLTGGYVAYRDLWPVLFASGPPPAEIDLADEAAQTIPVRWTIRFSGQPRPGKLVTQMQYNESDDTFTYTNRYTELRYERSGISVVVPELTTVVLVTRSGNLRRQSMTGRIAIHLGNHPIGDASAKIEATVAGGDLFARCEIRSSLGDLTRTLDPVPVPSGQPLNPLLPVNRISGLKPGRRWVVHESDPLGEAITTLLTEQAGRFGLKLPARPREPLIGEVLTELQLLDWNRESVPCRVIEYRRDEIAARTWVRATDGKVLKQEAFQKGERLTIERDQ